MIFINVVIVRALCEKCPNTEFFQVRIFPHLDWMQRDAPYLSVFSPNAGKSGPEKAPQGYDQKRKLFRTNSFVLAHSSAKKIYIDQFGVSCCWMFSYGSHIWAWMLFRKRHNKFLFLDFLRLLWYLLGIGHYWLDIFCWVGICVFLYSCMFLQYYLFYLSYLEYYLYYLDYFLLCIINYVFHVGHAAVAYFNVVFIEQLVNFVVSREVLIN